MSETVRVALSIVSKDAVVEWRTKTALLSSLVFAVLVLAILFVARDPTSVSAYDIAPSALWITFSFAAMLGLNRAFLLEHENRAIDAIRLTGASPAAIFIGKFAANLLFVGIVQLVSVPLFVLFYNVPIAARLPELLLVIFMATLAFVAVGTLLSSMVVQTRFAELMLPILLLPFLVPPVIGAVQITAAIVAGRPLGDVSGWLKLLAAFDLAFCTLTVLLFEVILNE